MGHPTFFIIHFFYITGKGGRRLTLSPLQVGLRVIRFGVEPKAKTLLIFREFQIHCFQSVPKVVPVLDPLVYQRLITCWNVLQS